MRPEEQADRNISLLGRQLEYFLDHPEELVNVAGKEVVLIPVDDPELAAENQALFERLRDQASETEETQPIQLAAAG
jgi:hypothetical protein